MPAHFNRVFSSPLPSGRRLPRTKRSGRGSGVLLQRALPGPEDITRVELPNGIVVLARSNFNSPSVVINGYMKAGSLFDTDEKLGLADFTAAALMRGTSHYTFDSLYNALESVGASLGFSGGTHTMSLGGRALAEDLDLLLGLLAESLRQPVFPPGEIEKLRAQLLTGLAMRAQDTSEMASMAFDKLVYPEHPYSRPEDGYTETIQAITLQDLTGFHQTHYGPRDLVVGIVGAVEPDRAVDLVAQYLGDWQNPAQPASPELPPLRPLSETLTRRVPVPGKSQADVVLGCSGPDRRAPDFLAASLGNSVLGQFGMYGRIGEAVREKGGLAYYAYSSLSGGFGPGPWYAAAGCDPANVDKTVDLTVKELERFTRQPVSAQELANCKANFIGRLPLSMESNGGVSSALLNLERYSLGLDYYRRYPGLVTAVTPEEILAAAQRYIDPSRLAIAIAGP
jgi:zinc protease